ncbi:ribosome assembly factor SBDS [Candidatus Micrarchaeota archaeon]|nr:ribosome assembly factor SBDS [Candidatus Micrarchaeota archaeon]
MVSLDKAIIASYKHGNDVFQVYVDPNLAHQYIEGKKKDLKNILVTEEIYSDIKKGERQKSSVVEKVFKTTDIMEILKVILEKGEVQLTTEQRKKKIEEKMKQLKSIILKETIDPRTKAPHTPTRIDNAFEEARITVDPFKDPREQLNDVIKKLRPILPLKFEKLKVAVKIPAEHAHKCYSTLKNYGIQQEQWTSDGSLIAVIEFPAGIQGEVYDKLNKMTAGTVETKVLEK